MVWVARERTETEMLVKRPSFVVFGVNGERTNAGNVRRLQRSLHRVFEQPGSETFPCQDVATARRARSMMGTGRRARPLVNRGGAAAYST